MIAGIVVTIAGELNDTYTAVQAPTRPDKMGADQVTRLWNSRYKAI